MVDNSKNLFSKIINDFNPKDENQANDLKKILPTMLSAANNLKKVLFKD